MMQRASLFLWIFSFFAADKIFAGSETFQPEKSHDGGPQENAGILEEASHLCDISMSSCNVITWEESPNKTAANDAKAWSISIPNRRGLSLSSIFPKSFLSVVLVVLLCAGLLNAAKKTREAPEELDEEKITEIDAEFEMVKALLPAAKSLALVVNSEKSHNLLNTLETIVGQNNIVATQEARKHQARETFFPDALRILRSLHDAALVEADAIVQADKRIPELSTLGVPPRPGEDALLAIEEKSERVATRPLIRTYRSLVKDTAALQEHIQVVAEQLSSQQFLLENEENGGELLLSTAAAFQTLRSTSAYRKRLIEVGEELGKNVIEGVKLKFAGYYEQAVVNIEGHLQAMLLRLFIRRNAVEANERSGSGALQLLGTYEEKVSLDALENGIRDVEAVVTQLHAHANELQTSNSLSVAAERGGKLIDGERNALALLTRCSQIEKSLPELPSNFDNETRLMALQMANDNVDLVFEESQRLKQSLQRLEELLNDDLEEGLPWKPDALNEVLITNVIKEAKAISSEAEKRIRSTKLKVKNLAEIKDAGAAVGELTATSIDGLFQVLDRGILNLLELGAHLIVLLEEDVSISSTQVHNIASQISRLPDHKVREYENLRRQFDAAKGNIKNAQTLLEAANAAADMRAHLFAMQRLFL